MPYREGVPAPPGYYYEESVRRGPVIAGAIVLGVPYALSLSVASGVQFENQTGWLAIPVLGPWLTLALRENCARNEFDCTDGGEGTRTLLMLNALMQTTGGILLAWGLTSKTERYVRNDVSLQLSPMSVGSSGYGFGALGAF